jgi:hemolysin III
VAKPNQARYTVAEEVANTITHGMGLLLSVAALVVMIIQAGNAGRDGSMPAVIVFGTSLVFLYFFSAVHHAIPPGRSKQLFLSLDHSGIFLLIAGTYTPFCLLLPEAQVWILLSVIWGTAAVGIAVQIGAFLTGRSERYEKIAFAFYLAMGWIPILMAGGEMFGNLASNGLAFLVAGGVSYSLGIVFYLWKRLPFGHAVWHVFVMGGSAFHFFSVLLYVIPASLTP